jgi:phosphate-selective porin
MKHNFRILIGVLAIALPMSINAQVKPVKPNQEPKQAKVEKVDKEKLEKEKLEKQERHEKQKGGLEMPRISGFVQGMYQANLSDEGELKDNTLRMRRVRLSVDGNLSKTVSYKIQGDFTRSPMLVDAFIKYKPCREFAIQLGQFKTPFTIESPINPVNLEIFDYGEAVQQLGGYKDVCGVGALGRDLGLMATGSLFPVEGEEGYKYSIVDYSIGVFNGNGANNLDNNNSKDLVGRLDVHPGLKEITLSGSYYYGKYTKDENIDCTRNRWAAGAQYNDGKFLLRGEYIGGKTGISDVTTANPYYNSNGYYGVVGYNFQAGEQKIMPVLRYEHFTKDASIVNGGTNWYTAGINYWPLKSVNCKLDYSLIQKEAGGNSHRVVAMVSYKF